MSRVIDLLVVAPLAVFSSWYAYGGASDPSERELEKALVKFDRAAVARDCETVIGFIKDDDEDRNCLFPGGLEFRRAYVLSPRNANVEVKYAPRVDSTPQVDVWRLTKNWVGKWQWNRKAPSLENLTDDRNEY